MEIINFINIESLSAQTQRPTPCFDYKKSKRKRRRADERDKVMTGRRKLDTRK